jgi:hypothetical protein
VAECFAQYSYQLWQEYKDGAELDESYRSIVADNKDDADYSTVHIYDPGADRPLDGRGEEPDRFLPGLGAQLDHPG